MSSDLISSVWSSPYTGNDPVSWFILKWDVSFITTWGPVPIIDYLGLMFPNQVQYGILFRFESMEIPELLGDGKNQIDYGGLWFNIYLIGETFAELQNLYEALKAICQMSMSANADFARIRIKLDDTIIDPVEDDRMFKWNLRKMNLSMCFIYKNGNMGTKYAYFGGMH